MGGLKISILVRIFLFSPLDLLYILIFFKLKKCKNDQQSFELGYRIYDYQIRNDKLI